MAKIHRTMRGSNVNMDVLRLKNEREVAIGNMNVNAAGDILGPGGAIVKDRNQRVKEQNALHTMIPEKGKHKAVANKSAGENKAAAQKAAELEKAEAERILSAAEKAITNDAPKGGLAAEMAEVAPKTSTKKKTTRKKKAE